MKLAHFPFKIAIFRGLAGGSPKFNFHWNPPIFVTSGIKARRVTTTTATAARSGKIPKIVVSLSCSAKPLVARNPLGPTSWG